MNIQFSHVQKYAFGEYDMNTIHNLATRSWQKNWGTLAAIIAGDAF